jgi:photosystem II stability/assembly factor-like uncharacterized protein
MIKKIFLLITAFFLFIPAFCQWKVQYKNNLGSLTSVFFVDNNNGWAVGSHGVILHYNGIEWKLQKSNTTCFLSSVFFLDNNNGWAVGDSGTILKYDGIKWAKQISGTNDPFLSVFFTDVNNGWIAKSCCDLLKYDGKMWKKPNTGIYTNLSSLYLFDSKNGWLSGLGGVLYKLNDTIWVRKYIRSSFQFYDLYSLSFTDSSNGWAVGSDGSSKGIIIQYKNSEWVEDTIGLSNPLNDVFFRNNNLGWAVGDKGSILKYKGYKWEKQDITDNNEPYIEKVYFVDDKKGWAVTWGGEILYTDNGGDSTTSINQNADNYSIELDNYPNPFTTQTTIKYYLIKSGRISLNIYDNFGRKINTLKDEVQEPGKYQVTFNSINLTPGIYYYVLQTDYIRESRRMVLIK